MCGKENAMAVALIEGVELSVCEKCAKFGKVTRVIKAPKPQKKSLYSPQPARQKDEDAMEFVVEDFAARIRQRREQLNLTQQEFSKMLSEKESVVHHLENASSHPSIELARKLERILHIKLIEVAKEAVVEKVKGKVDAFTLGDFIRIKK